MFIHQNIFLLSIRHMRVDLRCTDRTMSEHFLDIADIDILLLQQGGERMAEHMRCDMLFDSGEIGITVDHKTDGLIR